MSQDIAELLFIGSILIAALGLVLGMIWATNPKTKKRVLATVISGALILIGVASMLYAIFSSQPPLN